MYSDFEKAFDKVPHKRLISKLISYGFNSTFINWIQDFRKSKKFRVRIDISFYSASQCSQCKRCTSYGNSVRLSVRLSVTRRYCVKTTARSTVQFALSDSKMCLVLQKLKNIPQGRPLLSETLAPSDLPLLKAARFDTFCFVAPQP